MSEKSLIKIPLPHEEVSEEELWLAQLKSPQTRAIYRRSIQLFLEIYGINDAKHFRTITANDIIAYREFLKDNGYSPSSIRSHLSALNSLYAYLEKKKVIPHNPVSSVERPSFSRKPPVLLSKEALAQLLQAPQKMAKDKRQKNDTGELSAFQTRMFLRDQAILSVLVHTGCRVSELCQLTMADYGGEEETPILNFLLPSGKRHPVVIPPDCAKALQAYLAVTHHTEDSKAPLFVSRKKDDLGKEKRLTREQVFRIWEKYARVCKLKKTNPHSARYALVNHALAHGNSLEAVQQFLGHTSIQTTQAYIDRKVNSEPSVSLNRPY